MKPKNAVVTQPNVAPDPQPILTIPETSLGTIPFADVESLRVITKSGESRLLPISILDDKFNDKLNNITPSTTEQATGELYHSWVNEVEMNKVYTRTITGVSSSSGDTTLLNLPGSFATLISVLGTRIGGAIPITIASIVLNYNPGGTVVFILPASKIPANSPFIITLTYSRR